MDNKDIVSELRKAANLMELHDENEFKIKSYRNAIYNIERLEDPLEELTLKELEKVNGIGKSIAAKIDELNTAGNVESIEALVEQTPPGILEMISIKGLGVKKVKTMWQILGVTTIEELQQAIAAHKVQNLKGFGSKIEEKFAEIIAYYLANKRKLHFSKAESIANALIDQLKSEISEIDIVFTAELRRKMEVVSTISLLAINTDYDHLKLAGEKIGLSIDFNRSSPYRLVGKLADEEIPLEIFIASEEDKARTLLLSTGSLRHLSHKNGEESAWQIAMQSDMNSEDKIYSKLGFPTILPELREDFIEWKTQPQRLVELDDLKGVLHNHTTFSDGRHSLKEMTMYCKELGYEYLGISDHSKAAAFYANGLDEDRVKVQQDEIDVLNAEIGDFKIFKGIEADILPDGNIDYEPETLQTFDFVVASIHSVLNMDIKKATDRIIKAVNNPYTTMLGHMTGRQLLIREGYPLDHKAVIDACAENGVIIEVNAHPYRLDIDWRWIPYALDQGVKISINPDAHAKKGYHDMYYGVCVARKGGLTKENTFNALSVEQVSAHFESRKKRAIKKAS